MDDIELFKDKLGTKVIIEHEKGHYDGYNELPIVLEELLKIVE